MKRWRKPSSPLSIRAERVEGVNCAQGARYLFAVNKSSKWCRESARHQIGNEIHCRLNEWALANLRLELFESLCHHFCFFFGPDRFRGRENITLFFLNMVFDCIFNFLGESGSLYIYEANGLQCAEHCLRFHVFHIPVGDELAGAFNRSERVVKNHFFRSRVRNELIADFSGQCLRRFTSIFLSDQFCQKWFRILMIFFKCIVYQHNFLACDHY